MPKYTMTGSPVMIAVSEHGTFATPTQLIARIDPASEDVVYIAQRRDVTQDTDGATVGVPVLGSEPFSVSLQSAHEVWAIGDAGVELYVEKFGSR
jgi:hypothetical protein